MDELTQEQQAAVDGLPKFISEEKETDLYLLMEGAKGSVSFTPEETEILEGKGQEGHMRVRGLFQNSDTKNGNGRIYRKSLWKGQLNSSHVMGRIGESMWGELDHPKDGQTKMARVSHLVTKLELLEDGRLMGEAVISNEGPGKQLQDLFRIGGSIGISSRGGGSFEKDGVHVDEKTYVLDTFDFVSNESTKGARPRPVKEDIEVSVEKDITEESRRNNSNKDTKKMDESTNVLEAIKELREKIEAGEKAQEQQNLEDLHHELENAEGMLEEIVKRYKNLEERNKTLEEALELMADEYHTLAESIEEDSDIDMEDLDLEDLDLEDLDLDEDDDDEEEGPTLREAMLKAVLNEAIVQLQEAHEAVRVYYGQREMALAEAEEITERYLTVSYLAEANVNGLLEDDDVDSEEDEDTEKDKKVDRKKNVTKKTEEVDDDDEDEIVSQLLESLGDDEDDDDDELSGEDIVEALFDRKKGKKKDLTEEDENDSSVSSPANVSLAESIEKKLNNNNYIAE